VALQKTKKRTPEYERLGKEIRKLSDELNKDGLNKG
jgi:hypothetical protein